MWLQVLLKLLQQLGWNYISIVYDDDAYGRQAAEQLRDLAQSQELCVPSFTALPLDYRCVCLSFPLDCRCVSRQHMYFPAFGLWIQVYPLAFQLEIAPLPSTIDVFPLLFGYRFVPLPDD